MDERDTAVDIDPETEDQIRRTLQAVAAITPDTLDEVVAIPQRRPVRVRPVTIAAALLVLAALGATVIATLGRDDRGSETAGPAAAPTVTPAAVTMVPDALPEGFSLVGDIMDSVIGADPIQRRVYARSSSPDDTTSWINLWFSSSQLEVSCDAEPDVVPFMVGDAAAATCTFRGGPWTSAVWKVGDVVVLVTASSSVTRAELVAFSQSLVTEPVDVSAPDVPSLDLRPAATAVDWVPLLAADPAVDATIRQSVWTASSGAGSVQVWAMNGAPDAALYMIQQPVDAQRVTVNGRDALYGQDAAGEPYAVSWIEEDGLVMSVTQAGVLDRAGLIAFAETLHTVDQAGLDAFASAGGVGFTQPTP